MKPIKTLTLDLFTAPIKSIIQIRMVKQIVSRIAIAISDIGLAILLRSGQLKSRAANVIPSALMVRGWLLGDCTKF